MPLSSGLILHLVASTPVMAPATEPANAAAAVAIRALCPWTIKAAATEAPSVTDPSAVISGILKMRKLTYTPSASSARINPSVKAPINSVMSGSSSCDRVQRTHPAGAASQVGFSHALKAARIRHQVQDGIGRGYGKGIGNRAREGQFPARHRPIGKCCGVNMRADRRVAFERTNKRGGTILQVAAGNSHQKAEALFGSALRG